MESDKVEVCDQRVAVCRDHANGQCKRKQSAPQSMLLPSSIVASSSSLSSLPQSAISTITAAAAANILASKSMTTSSILSSSPSSGLGSTGMIATVGGTTVAQVDTTDVTSTSTCIKNLFINNHHHTAANNGSIIGVNSTNSNTNLFSLNAAGNSNNNDCNSNFITLSVPSSTQQPQVPCNSSASSANIIDHSASTTAKDSFHSIV
ncbi:unnamed protein product [Hermetia illucens]|uniref:Uncharacterized protein n=1 Tax=Hermetia illucens TaxID=343691 RepID=A0A7R8YXM3_HERIL|nr:unnamed protein product [Hermetia illucens]